MAGDGAGSPRECGSPHGTEGSSRDRGDTMEQHSPRISVLEQNGQYYTQNGHHNSHHSHSEDSRGEEESMDSSYDAPLDFSLKRRETVSDSDEGESKPRVDQLGMEPISPPPLHRADKEEGFMYKPGPTVFPQLNGLHSPPMPKTENCVSPRQCKSEEKIGEPQTAMPGMVPGMTLPSSSAQMGLLPGFPGAGLLPQTGLLNALPFLHMDPRLAAGAGLLAPGKHQEAPRDEPTKNGTSRAFKSFPKESLTLPLSGVYGLPGLPQPVSNVELAAAQAMSANSEELFSQYRQVIQRMQELSPNKLKNGQRTKPPKERRGSGGSTSSHISSNAAHSGSEQGSPAIRSSPGLIPTPVTLNTSVTTPTKGTTTTRPGQSISRKRPKTMPDELKDTAYWERRRKNNEAAKRSRDARRAKEDEIAIRAAFLEQENLKLRVEVAALKNETSKLRCMLYNS